MKIKKMGYLASISLAALVLSSQVFAAGKAPMDAKVVKKAMVSSKASIAAGKKSFKTYCASCHGESGDANTPVAKVLNPPPRNLADASVKWTAGKEPADVYNTVANGLPGTSMVGFKASLNEVQRWEVVHFIGSLAGSKGKFKAVTKKNVDKIYKQTQPKK